MVYLASVPLALPFLLLIVLKQSGLRTSLLSAVAAIVVACFFTINIADIVPITLQSVGNALAIAFGVLTVLFPGLLLYRLQVATGGLSTIVKLLQGLFQSRELQILALVIGASPFVEAISGFGVSVLVIAPILLALGYSPLKAGILVLISQISVSLGALGVGTMIGAQLANLPVDQVGIESLLLSAPLPALFAVTTLAVCGGIKSLSRYWLVALICGAVKGGGDYYFAKVVGIEVAGALASLMVLFVLFAISSFYTLSRQAAADKKEVKQEQIWSAIGPYAILIATLLITRIIPPVQDFLTSTLVIAPFDAGFNYPLLYIPGFWVTIAALSVVIINDMNFKNFRDTARQTWKQFLPAGTTIVLFLVIAQVMILSGMAETVATAGGVLGSGYVFLAPVLGALSGWLTGSNSGGNAMFMPLQVEVSQNVQLPTNWTAAAQNAASSYGTMASPARVALVSVTVGDSHIEGRLLSAMVPYVIASAIVVGTIYSYIVL
ncbi:L-lactate permease [Motiliproteus sp. MSK22-1]|uniref:L-lactate permease n=1 Tax=Motiliproteus sp. MSK22-1 TaxID=1897630 RepID=UPI0009761AEE|nr:L-lactate permease [Motiliproteus sp. MSK22-1]OMH33796.1 hypothetical protein BGP75_12460 [Motiliproteus sp. MSK22-1]